jgi:hypothetical protein
MTRFQGVGNPLTLKGLITNRVSLASGNVSILSPAGEYWIRTGPYTTIQQLDPITGIWWKIGGGVVAAGVEYVYSDGVNYRLANQTGCPVGALLTTAGSSYTSAPAVAASAGSSVWKALVGGAVNTTVTVSNAGTNYTYPPLVVFSQPPYGAGIQATGHSTLSGSTVASVVVDNQGAGYGTAPTITFVNDPREGLNGVTAGYNAAAVCTLTGANTVTGVLCLDHGVGGQTSVPTLSFSGGGGSSAAATAIMCWSITAFTPTNGTGFGTSLLSGIDAFPTTAAAYTNPATQSLLVSTRLANIKMLASSGAPTATNAVFYDGGIYTSTPTPLVTTNGALITQTATFTFTMGGYTDTSYVMQL